MSFLAAAAFFQSILKIIARLSFKFEENSILAFEVEHAVQLARTELEDLCVDEESEISKAGIAVEGCQIAMKLAKPGHMKRKAKNRVHSIEM